jgi:hypothetical protein
MKFSKKNKVAYRIYAICFLAILTLALSGCASIHGVMKELEQDEILVQVGVAHYLDANQGQALEINRVTNQTLQLITTNEKTTVGEIKEFFEMNIQWVGMLPEDRMLLMKMIDSVSKDWMKGLTANGVTNAADQVVKTREFLEWLQTASARYVNGRK